MKKMQKSQLFFVCSLAVLLGAALIIASCKLIPEIEGTYPPFNTPKTPSSQTPQTPESGRDTDESGEQEKQLFGRTEQDQGNETLVEEPLFSTEKTDQEPAVLPDTTAQSVQPDESIVQQQPPPPAPAPQPPPLPPSEPPPTTPPASQPTQPAPVAPPPAPPPPLPPVPPTPPPAPPPAPPQPSPIAEEAPQPIVPPQEEKPSIPVPDMPFQPAAAVPLPAESDLPYSRTVRAQVGQFIEIPFRGSGWVYLGEFGSRRGVSYDSRRMDEDGMTFIFRADSEGTYSLRFNRHDFVRDFILNDYVRVIVEQSAQTTGSSWSNTQTRPDRVYASPRWPLATDPEGRVTQEQNTNQQTETTPAVQGPDQGTNQGTIAAASAPNAATSAANTAVPGASPAAAGSSGTSPGSAAMPDTAQGTATGLVPTTATVEPVDDWLKKAWEEYNAGRIKGALDALDQYMILFPAGSDEAYWLYGQSLEANNEATRDIRLALDYYRRLTREYPQSSRHDQARQRIVYLERFYFNIQ